MCAHSSRVGGTRFRGHRCARPNIRARPFVRDAMEVILIGRTSRERSIGAPSCRRSAPVRSAEGRALPVPSANDRGSAGRPGRLRFQSSDDPCRCSPVGSLYPSCTALHTMPSPQSPCSDVTGQFFEHASPGPFEPQEILSTATTRMAFAPRCISGTDPESRRTATAAFTRGAAPNTRARSDSQ